MEDTTQLERLDADMLVIDLIAHGSPAAYVLKRVVGVDIETGGDDQDGL